MMTVKEVAFQLGVATFLFRNERGRVNMQVTINLTESMIEKMEVYRAMNIEQFERLIASHEDVETKDFLSRHIESYRSKSIGELVERYLV